jgi:hypothetical protein
LDKDLLLLLIVFTASGLLLAGLAVPLILGKIPPNGLYGFRVRKTMEHPEIWYPVNKVGGKWLLVAGSGISLTAVLAAFIPGLSLDVYAYIVLGAWLILFSTAILVTVRYLRSL